MIFPNENTSGIAKKILYWYSKSWVRSLGVSLLIALLQIIYLLLRYEYINDQVPFFYTKPWGDYQLGNKEYLFALPAISVAITVGCLLFYKKAKEFYWQLMDKLLLLIPIAISTVIGVSLVRIIFNASSPFQPLVNPQYLSLLPSFLLAFILTTAFTPRFIEYFNRRNIVTNPKVHAHPSMILSRPSARGGGLVFAIFLIVTSAIFVGFTKYSAAIYISIALVALLGIMDDYQNTNPKSKLRILENPMIRLAGLFVIVTIPIYMGIRINFINNPFSGIFDILQYQVTIAGTTIPWLSIILTALWMVWVMNVLSWSNGVDGQYGGIVGIACIVIAVLSLRFELLTELHLETAKIVAAGAGAAIGLTHFNWYPSKIMWGFGAMAAGLLISMTSITIGAKIATSTLIILIPFLDAVFIFIRRLAQKKNPLKGDRGHLHHLLMDRGWGVRRIAAFYWVTTAFFGIIGILTAGQNVAQVSMTVIGVVAFVILLLRFTSHETFKQKLKKMIRVPSRG